MSIVNLKFYFIKIIQNFISLYLNILTYVINENNGLHILYLSFTGPQGNQNIKVCLYLYKRMQRNRLSLLTTAHSIGVVLLASA